MLAAGGVGMLVLTIASLRERWPPTSESLWPFLALLPVSAALVILFDVINPAPKGRSLLSRIFRPLSQSLGVGVATILIIIGAAGFWLAMDPANEPKQFDRFLMQLPAAVAASSPTDAPAPQTEPTALQASKSPPTTPPPSAEAPAAPFVMWSVEREGRKPPTGALPTFLAALLIIAFGLWFPHVRLDDTEKALPQLSKFVAPALSLGLLGVGATQNVTAEKIKADEKLTKQGLPAYITAPSADRQTMRERIYITTPAETSPEALAQLQVKFEVLQGQLAVAVEKLGSANAKLDDAAAQRARDTQTATSLTALSQGVDRISVSMKNRQPPAPLTDVEIDRLATSLKTLGGATQVSLLAPTNCENIRMQIAAAGGVAAPAQTEAGSPRKPPKPDNAFERSWYWFSGKASPYEKGQDADKQKAQIAALERQRVIVCGGETGVRMASSDR